MLVYFTIMSCTLRSNRIQLYTYSVFHSLCNAEPVIAKLSISGTDTDNFLHPFEDRDMQYAQWYAVDPGAPVSHEFLEAAEAVMIENNLLMPQSVEQVLDFYLERKHLLSIDLGACNCHFT